MKKEENKPKPSRAGGARAGAGRPAALPGATRRSIMIDEETAKKAAQISRAHPDAPAGGSVSIGIAIAVANHKLKSNRN